MLNFGASKPRVKGGGAGPGPAACEWIFRTYSQWKITKAKLLCDVYF